MPSPTSSFGFRAWVTLVTATSLAIACGSSGDSVFVEQGPDGGVAPPSGEFGGVPDAGAVGADPRACKPRTCAEQGIECGPAGDGCGGVIPDCGKCGAGLRCGGPNAHSKCVSPNVGTGCVPKTCAEQGIECGMAGDGCGGILTCGTCGAGKQCGATGQPSKCVAAVPTGPDGGACVAKTCADYLAKNMDCGVQSDGCGGTIDCGQCVAPEFCGGGGPSKCAISGGGACVLKTCADYVGKCGPQSNGCGGVTADCGGCVAPQICGGGGVPGECGGGGAGPGGGPCVPRAACGPQECGKVADGCGGVLDCGVANCTNGKICGGGGTPNVCGAPACVPVAACPANMNCGSIADGCGGTVQCGNGNGCAAPQICGGGGMPNVCGGGGGGNCVPLTCAQTGKECGPVADGCGGIVDCPACVSPAICGGGGVPSMCGGANQCTPKTVADCPANGCGFIADGCGGLVQCGVTCPGGGVCGATTPNVCGAGAGPCTGFCQNQDATCGAGSLTKVTGKVFAPNGTLPLPGALVYVPNGATATPYGISPITSGVVGGTCDQCDQAVSGSPLVSTTSGADGSFTLDNVPAGVAFPLVVQLGKWRRMVTIPATTRCTSRTLTPDQARLPTRQNEGNNGVDNVPLIAISTGQVDGLECVFRKLGLTSNGSSNQFGNPPGTSSADRGRIRLYRDNDSGSARGGARIDNNTPRTDSALTDTQAHLDQYDAVIFGCAGARNDRSAAIKDRVTAYADKGGRVFATHFEYVYLYNHAPWDTTTAWDVPNARSSGNGNWTGEVNTGSVKRLLFSQWLGSPGVTALSGTNPPRITITEARNNADRPVSAGAEEWITRYNDPDANDAVLHYTFNTPWGAPPANQCGRVLFSDFHVTLGNTSGTTFPNECDNGGLTNQEKVLAFFLFDLTSCIQSTPPPVCAPRTCADYPAGTCGAQSDGCGGITENCGACPNGQTCGGGGVQNQCGGPTCTPKTCAEQGANCGTVPDGCGGTVNCPDCPAGQTCGGGGVAYQCGVASCTPQTCAAQGVQCGQTGDGCGNAITCPPCPAGTTCGGGGVPNQCGAPACVPIAACPPGKNCGMMPDGCGGAISCGNCPAGQSCGGGGAANVCGAASCSPKTCVQQGAQCGMVSNGCGGVVQCPMCPAGDYCNGVNQCVSPNCTPKTCTQLGVQCGPTANTCGGLVDCGPCPPGQGCGAGGVPGQCGALACKPRTCNDLGAVCGQVADGCGGLTPNCGDCQAAESCKNGVCVAACTPRTCAAANAQCGFISDGCGAVVDCGVCPPGSSCGFNGSPNICGNGGPK
ncbi:MAG: hypothetical protein KC657_04790 [Myxococcales bacterium]|nr:hypothetical protein [Myxococcales bacterium]